MSAHSSSSGSAYCESDQCFRSLWETLATAAASFALFAAANWGMPAAMAERGFAKRLLFHIRFALAIPFLPYWQYIDNLDIVRVVLKMVPAQRSSAGSQLEKSSSAGRINGGCRELSGSLSILALCPIYLRVPVGTVHELGDHVALYELVTEEAEVLDLYPLQLPATEYWAEAESDVDAEAAPGWVYLKVPETASTGRGLLDGVVEERCALLASLPALPDYRDVCFLRTRSSFQSGITALQAVGYVVRILQRVGEQLRVSPMEAIITCLCIIIVVQMAVEMYACVSYQRPLLLRLHSHQLLRRLRDAPRDNLSRYQELYCKQSVSRVLSPVGLLTVVGYLVPFGFSFPAIYYFGWALGAKDNLAALSALLFSLALIGSNYVKPKSPRFLLPALNTIFVSSMIFAAIATMVRWEKLMFNVPSRNNIWTRFIPYLSG